MEVNFINSNVVIDATQSIDTITHEITNFIKGAL
jgi:hypothetical protein